MYAYRWVKCTQNRDKHLKEQQPNFNMQPEQQQLQLFSAAFRIIMHILLEDNLNENDSVWIIRLHWSVLISQRQQFFSVFHFGWLKYILSFFSCLLIKFNCGFAVWLYLYSIRTKACITDAWSLKIQSGGYQSVFLK